MKQNIKSSRANEKVRKGEIESEGSEWDGKEIYEAFDVKFKTKIPKHITRVFLKFHISSFNLNYEAKHWKIPFPIKTFPWIIKSIS